MGTSSLVNPDMDGLGQSSSLVAAFDVEGNTMSESRYLGSLMGSPSVDEEFTPPITHDQAKAQGLKVYQSRYYCRRSSKHGALKVTRTNQCVQCAELERNIEADLRAKVMDKLKAEAERKALRQAAAILADAHRQAADIIKAAQKEAMDKAKMLEKAKATREAKKAQAAVAQAEVVTQPEGPQTAQVGPEVAPWDEPVSMAQEAPQRALEGDGLSDQGDRCPADDEGSEPPW